ncbi:MAG: efflux RND transporter permease subunit [Rhizobiaceae bacterium]|nr:efflux RND transporter permease subunit [Rhizobiaceae bacterium]
MDIVKLAIKNSRLTLATLFFLIVAGALTYQSIPKEAEPDVAIPILYISLGYQGISPEDAERLLLRPVEAQVKGLKGLKEMKSSAYQGGGFVLLEFDPSTNLSTALEDTRNKVSDAKRDLPSGADDPTVNEVNISEFPVLVVTLSGHIPERTLTAAARELRDQIEEVPGVLEASLQGARDDLVEVVIDPMKLSSYGLQLDQMVQAIGASNSLVAAGALKGEEGSYPVKVPALIETVEDVANLPIVASGNAVVRAQDLATIRSTYKDAVTITRLDGEPAIAIEVKKRTGANIVETIEATKLVADNFAARMPEGVNVTYTQDKSVFVNQLLGDLQNHVMIAVILVFIVILYALTGRASMLIGLAIPASFLMGILMLGMLGYTMNMIVLFSLILAVGMLVDDAIIVTEFAERRMSEGMPKEQAFELAAKRMAGPVIAATMTRIAAFSPLLFWPGIIGDFMKYLPITLIVTLAASMLYALVFTPTLGAIFAKVHPHSEEERNRDGLYMKLVRTAVQYPKTVLVLTVLLLAGIVQGYGKYGAGVEFFPSVEPDYGLLYVHARGNLSLQEQDALTRQAENRLLGWPGIKSVYTRVGSTRGGGADIPEDVIGVIQYEFIDWRERKSANDILDDLRVAMAGIAGADVEVRVPDAGPPTGQPIQVRLSAADPTGLNETAARVAAEVAKVPGAIDITDGLPPPGVDWALEIDRTKAAQYGISPYSVGTVVQLVTTGLKLTDYRPAGVDDAVDIRLRLPEDRRTLATLDQLRVETAQGSVPISNFVTRVAEKRTGILNRIDGERTIVVQGNVASGFQDAVVQASVKEAVGAMDLGQVKWELAGSNQDSEEASAFLTKAFGAAIFLIFIVLLAQFNKFTSVFLVLMTVIMATIGVFLGLMITGQSFVIVMSGIGVIALAGVVVNNNIVLIDTYDRLRREGWTKMDAVLQTCRERARPVVLTAISAILGVLPIAFGLGLELFHHETTINAPSTQWWIALSSAIVFGLAFATLLTLIVTPSALMVFTREKRPEGERRSLLGRLFRRRSKTEQTASTKDDEDAAVGDFPAVSYPKAAE